MRFFGLALLLGASVSAGAVDFETLKARVQATAPHPERKPAFESTRQGVFETQMRDAAKSFWLLELIKGARGAEPGLIDALVQRIEAESSYMYAKPVEGGFAMRFFAVLDGLPPLQKQTQALKDAADALASDAYKVFELRTNPMPDAEKSAQYAAIDIPGKRAALRGAVEALLTELSPLDPGFNASWKTIQDFIKEDASRALADADKGWANHQSELHEMREAFNGALKGEDGALILSGPSFERLEKLNAKIDSERRRLIFVSLAPGAAPTATLAGEARVYAAELAAFDSAFIKQLGAPKIASDAGNIRAMDGLYAVWDSLDRQTMRREAGTRAAPVERLNALIDAGMIYLTAENWNSAGVDPHSGHEENEPIARQAAHAIDVLRRFQESLAAGRPVKPLMAAVDVDAAGKPVWLPGGWLRWKWIEPDELADLEMDRRVVKALGRRWLLPAGSETTKISTIEEATAAKAKQLVVAVDPRGAWSAP